MTTENPTLPAPERPARRSQAEAMPSRRQRSVPHAGWIVVAQKEFADHLQSVRFVVLLFVLGIAAVIPMYFTADAIRTQASQITDRSSLFLALFAYSPDAGGTGITIPAAVDFIRIVGPLLGVAFAFDAVNGERANGTLPRLMSQPIHRDDVINGKFAAALMTIGLVFVVVVVAIAAFGIIRLGIAPTPEELLRLAFWVILTFLYVAAWVAFGILLSVLVRSSATSALIGFGVWLLLTIFGGLIIGFIAGIASPITGTLDQQAGAAAFQQTITRLNPATLHGEGTIALLNPQVASVSSPTTLNGFVQAAQRIPSLQTFEQSLLLVWPHFVTLFAITAGLFALAYFRFMRQEVRA
jgi:ABC-2 type transport system permease protein